MQGKSQRVTLADVGAARSGAVEGQPREMGAHRTVEEMCCVVKSIRDRVNSCSVDKCVSLCHNRFDATSGAKVPRLAGGAHLVGDVSREPVRDVLVVGFHHHPDHLFGS